MTRGWVAVGSSIAAVVAGAQLVVTQPGYVQGLVEYAGRSQAQAGYILSAEMSAFALTTIAMTVIVGRIRSRLLIGAALLGLIAGNLLSILLLGSDAFVAGRILVGIASGVLVPLGFSAIALTSDPDRYFGVMIACVLIYGALVLGALPVVFAFGGFAALLVVFAAFGALGLIGVRWFPEPAPPDQGAVGTPGDRRLTSHGWAALGGMLAYFTAIGAFWAYAALMGKAAGLTDQEVATALSVSQLAGIAGTLVPMMLGTRFGRGWPLTVGIAAGIVPMAVFVGPFGAAVYLIMIAVYNFGWNVTHPYLLGTFASLDQSGRIVVYATAMQKIGLALGPALAAVLIDGTYYRRSLILAIALAALCLVLVLPAARTRARGRRIQH